MPGPLPLLTERIICLRYGWEQIGELPDSRNRFVKSPGVEP